MVFCSQVAPKKIFAVAVVAILLALSGLVSYIVYLLHQTNSGMDYSKEANENPTIANATKDFFKNYTNIMNSYTKWLNLTRYLNKFDKGFEVCPLCRENA
jgi:CHASE1-domain containing sensor protein